MVSKIKWLSACLSLCIATLSLAATAATGKEPTVTLTDPSKPIMVTQASPQFTISLASNPTTGYSWFVTHYDHQLINLVSHVYKKPEVKRMGAGGVEIWTFQASAQALAAPHITKIEMLYARPWNVQEQSRVATFTVVIR